MKYWFAVEVDRDYKTNSYASGVRLYVDNTTTYQIIKGVSYENNILVVKNINNELITLEKEPNNLLFENSVFDDWVKWDKKYGESENENRIDFEPWAYASKKALAFEFNLYKLSPGEVITNYFKKPF